MIWVLKTILRFKVAPSLSVFKLLNMFSRPQSPLTWNDEFSSAAFSDMHDEFTYPKTEANEPGYIVCRLCGIVIYEGSLVGDIVFRIYFPGAVKNSGIKMVPVKKLKFVQKIS